MLDLPCEIVEDILKYLSIDDLLNATLVSKQWNDFIGKSLTFKKKIIINVNLYSSPEISKNRTYESLSVRLNKVNNSTINLMKNHPWRSVYFHILKITTQNYFAAIINDLKDVKELKVMNVAIKKLVKNHKKIVLPELENLVFSDVAVDTFECFIANQPSLKSLSLRFVMTDIANEFSPQHYFIEFLRLNQQLLSLELYNDAVNNLFQLEVAKILPLKLRSIAFHLGNLTEVVQKNVEELLKSQEGSMEELKLVYHRTNKTGRPSGRHGIWYADDYYDYFQEDQTEALDLSILLNVWMNLSNLKKLTLRFFGDFTESEIDPTKQKSLKANVNIKVLNIQYIEYSIPIRTVLLIMKLCPNLTALYVSTLDKNLMTFCALNLKLLRNVSYIKENEDAVNLYSQMVNSGDCNKFIKFHKEYRG